MNEYAILLTTGHVIYTGGFDSAASLRLSIVHQWDQRGSDFAGIEVAMGLRSGSGQHPVPASDCPTWGALIDPAHVAAVIDLRPEN